MELNQEKKLQLMTEFYESIASLLRDKGIEDEVAYEQVRKAISDFYHNFVKAIVLRLDEFVKMQVNENFKKLSLDKAFFSSTLTELVNYIDKNEMTFDGKDLANIKYKLTCALNVIDKKEEEKKEKEKEKV